ncbi:glycosyltransferase family A protein [Acuticoccus sp. MNP-M23]|uniref:glycosyltransferase family A protein n=1 Tax=Acuticoccus sp. MNP-M23 TaxID=3072793 RepID=UPI002814CE09|nr:glycosyltransferase family A protein [Acuticoccus sp. MNP-M23]WMS44544.1 glycosyltransferase family A protein [Acuticoccus sp. MNP-M23]
MIRDDYFADVPASHHADVAQTHWHARAAHSGCELIACVPARDEEDRIGDALASLARTLKPSDGIVVVVNGSSDATCAIAAAHLAAIAQPSCLAEVTFAEGRGSAPLARRIALDAAHKEAPAAALFSFDSDSRCAPDLRCAYAVELARGYDLVCGTIGFDPEEAAMLPPADADAETLVREARHLTREIAARIDPDPFNPWPHHGNIGGANFVITGAAYRTVGGLPLPPSGEDRALLRLVHGHGLAVRYSDGPHVVTSCRIEGRAHGGLSDDLRFSRLCADPVVDEMLEPAETLVLRHCARRAFLAARDQAARAEILKGLGLGAEEIHAALGQPLPGLMWLAAEDTSPALRRTRLRRSDLRAVLPGLKALKTELDAEEAGRHGSLAGAPSS